MESDSKRVYSLIIGNLLVYDEQMKLMLSIPLARESVRQAHTLFLRWDENSTTVGKGKYLKRYLKKVPDYGGRNLNELGNMVRNII